LIKNCIFCGKAIEYSGGYWYNVNDGVHHRCIGPVGDKHDRKEKYVFGY
jgi:hypothetical protein